MKLSKSLLSAGVLTAVAVGSLAGVTAISAFDGNGSNRDALIDRIAADTGADRDTIEASFEAHHQEMETQMKERETERLQKLVDDGTITAEQKDAIIAKREEMHAKIEELKNQNLSEQEMHDQMDMIREDFETWAEAQGIDLNTIRPERGNGMMRHEGGRRHGHSNNDNNDESDDSSQQIDE